MFKKISVSTSHDKFNIQKSRVNFFGRGVSALLVTDKCHFYSLLLAYGDGIFHTHCLETRTLCVFSEILNCSHFDSLSWFAPSTFRPGYCDPEVQGSHLPGVWTSISREQDPRVNLCCSLSEEEPRASQTYLLTELPCPFQTHLGIADGIASHCFVKSHVWLPLPL